MAYFAIIDKLINALLTIFITTSIAARHFSFETCAAKIPDALMAPMQAIFAHGAKRGIAVGHIARSERFVNVAHFLTSVSLQELVRLAGGAQPASIGIGAVGSGTMHDAFRRAALDAKDTITLWHWACN